MTEISKNGTNSGRQERSAERRGEQAVVALHCDNNHNHEHKCAGENHDCCHLHHAKMTKPAQMEKSTLTKSVYYIPNMDCPMEEALIRKKLSAIQGVKGLNFNLMQRVLTVEHFPGLGKTVENALKSIDMAPQNLEEKRNEAQEMSVPGIPWKKLAWGTVLAAFSELLELAGHWHIGLAGQNPAESFWGGYSITGVLSLALAVAAIGLSGLGTYKKGWLAISNFNLNINALMSVAVTGAVLVGQFPEAAMVMVLFNISEAIEAKALDKVRHAVKELMSLAPDTAVIRMPDGSWQEMEVKDIKIGAVARVRPGQKIALDGEVVSGQSMVNQAPITGESMPVEKKTGDYVYAGTINESGSLDYVVKSCADGTTLARIIHEVEEAQASKAPVQKFIDKFARYYTPAVFLLAMAWAVIVPCITTQSWHESIYTALVILVIGCPCALVISTPVTVVSGLAAATRKGILVKGGLYIEEGRRINWLALDKTGTLTYGEPAQTDMVILNSQPDKVIMLLAASLAFYSDHPVSKAVYKANVHDRNNLLEITCFTNLPGKGISGIIKDKKWNLGNYALMESLNMATPELQERMAYFERQGKTAVALAGEDEVAAIFAVADKLRETSIEAIRQLKELHVRALMLTGDNRHTASAIATDVGVEEFRSNLLPNEKLQLIEELQKNGNVVAMAGDGINDAPALAKANIGFAMAACGTDTAIETADVALMDDDLRKIPAFIRLSKATHAILMENIVLALGIKAVFFALTLTGNATMWMAVFADVGAALLVIANGLRAMRK